MFLQQASLEYTGSLLVVATRLWIVGARARTTNGRTRYASAALCLLYVATADARYNSKTEPGNSIPKQLSRTLWITYDFRILIIFYMWFSCGSPVFAQFVHGPSLDLMFWISTMTLFIMIFLPAFCPPPARQRRINIPVSAAQSLVYAATADALQLTNRLRGRPFARERSWCFPDLQTHRCFQHIIFLIEQSTISSQTACASASLE